MVRKVLLVVFFALAAALFVQCGTPKPSCNCPSGCCDSSNVCQPGNTALACGKGGAACTACPSGEGCSAQACTGGTGGGSGGGTANTGGGTASTGGGVGSTGGGSGQACDVASSPSCPSGSVCLINSSTSTTAGACVPGCDPAGQNCGAGKKCTYVAMSANMADRLCVDAGTVAEDGTCAQDSAGDNCQAGLFCLQGKCVQFCNFSSVMCDSGKSCSGRVQLQTEFPQFCVPGCSLLHQDCPGAQGCLPGLGGGAICTTVGTLDAGAPCSGAADCSKGIACVTTSSMVCLPFCNLDGGAPACATGSCAAPQPALPEGAGFCL